MKRRKKRRKRSPKVEIETESKEEIDMLYDIVKREVREYREIMEKSEEEERIILDYLGDVDLIDEFMSGSVWITVIPEKREED